MSEESIDRVMAEPELNACTAGSKLLSLYLADKKSLGAVYELTFGWIHLLEGFACLFSGNAPTDVVSGRASGRRRRRVFADVVVVVDSSANKYRFL